MNQIGQVMKRENWVNDKEAKECQSCGKPFNLIFRRKHHCRNCGRVFQFFFFLRCSNHFLPGQYFRLEKTEQKVRLCQGCHSDISQSLQSQGIEIEKKKVKKEEKEEHQEKQRNHSKSFSTPDDYLPQSAVQVFIITLENKKQVKTPKINQEIVQDEEDSLQTQETITEELDDVKKVYEQMKDYFDQKIQALIEIVTKKSNLNIQWYQAILQFVKNAIQDIQIDTLSDQSMDILNYVKIKRIPFINYNATQYMRGVCLRKNVAHKKMQTYWKLPQILIIKGKLDTDIQNLDNFLKIEKEWLKKIYTAIQKLSPNVIFVEKSVNVALLNDLAGQNITVAQNFSEKQFQRILNITSTKSYKATEILTENLEIVLGKCDKLIFANYDPESILSNHAVASMLNDQNRHDLQAYMKDKLKRDTTILFIQNLNAKNQVSITLSGPLITELKLVKKTIKEAITLSYEMLMEREFSQIDIKLRQYLLQQFKPHANPNLLMATCGSITDYIASKLQQDLQLLRESQYNEIRFIRTDFVAIHDLQNTSNHSIERYINERIKGQIYNSKIPWVCKCCEIISGIQVHHFKDGKDRSLIQELLNLKLQQNTVCNNDYCKQILGNHFRIIYGPGAYIRIQVKKKGLALKNLQRENSELSQMDYSNIDQSRNSFDPASTVADTVTQKSTTLIQVDKQQNQETNRKVQCEVFLECANKDCNHKLTKQLRLKKKNFEFSYHKFLRHLMVDVIHHKQPQYQIENQGAKEPKQIKISDQQSYLCYHTTIQRVFTIEDYEIKFYCNQYQVFRNSELRINFDEYQLFDKKMLDRKRGQYDQIFETYKLKADIKFNENKQKMRQSSNNLSKLNDKKKDKKTEITPQDIRDKIDKLKLNSNQNLNFIDFECECMSVVMAYRNFEHQFETHPKNQMINMLIPKETQQELQRKNMTSSIKQTMKITSAKTLDKKPRQSLVNDPIGEAFSDSDHESDFQLDKREDETISLQLFQPQEDIPMNYFEMKFPEYLFPFIPIYCEFHFIAYALNLPLYHQKVYQKDFKNYRDKFISQKAFDGLEHIRDIMTSEKDIKLSLNIEIRKQCHDKRSSEKRTSEKQDLNKEQITQGKSPQSPLDGQQESTSNFSPLLSQQSVVLNEKYDLKNEKYDQSRQKKPRYEAEVILYYPKQFECLRQINHISLYMFIMSVVSCKAWNSQGGKSGSTFFKSEDNLLVFKAIKENEFQSYVDFAPKYFQHMFNRKIGVIHDKKLEKSPSVLNVIYGLFEIRFQKQTTWFIAMENLFQGMTGDLQIYDLKGSQAKRWQKKGNTMLDTNYIIDRNFEPLPVQNEDFVQIKRALESDAQFLQDCHIVDYSLMLIIEKNSSLIRIGIIDYLQQYSLQKKLENKLKKVMNLGKDPTIVQPRDYRQRFMEAMLEYFMGVPTQL